MAYKVIFIDEEKGQHELFQDYMDAAADQIEVICVYPEAYLDKMIARIEEYRPDAIVTDFLLNDIKEDVRYNIPYNGVELVKEYRNNRNDFPCFIITSFDNEAVSETDDVNLVYVKLLLNNGEIGVKAHFYDKIKEQISKYRTSVESAQAELAGLIEKKSKEVLQPYEEARIIHLDEYLEKTLDNYESLPSAMKEASYLSNMTKMIDKVDELIAKLG